MSDDDIRKIMLDATMPVDLAAVVAEIARLAALPVIDYEQERKAAAKQLNFRAGVLDQAVERERKKQATAAKAIAPLDCDALAKAAAEIITNDDILNLFANDFGKVIAGEAVNGKLLYLIATSRLLDKTMNVAIKGTSAGGKSEIRKQILNFFPPESIVSFTSLSEKALIYYEGGFEHKIFSMGEASAIDEQNFQDYLLRELMSEGRIRHSTVQKVGSDLVAVTIEKEGPVAFLVTTTRNKLHPENETRMLSLEIDDSEGQTKDVLRKVAQVEGLNHATAQVEHKRWQDFQRWLEIGERRVVVPYADTMVELIPPKAVRLRRDIGQVIRAIKAHALLHRGHRERDAAGAIVADIEHDYSAVRELMNAILAEGSGVAMKKATVETVRAVEQTTAALSETEGASAQDIAKALKLDKSAAWRRLSAARLEGYVVNLEQRKGMPGKYRVATQATKPEPEINILPEQGELKERVDASQSPPENAQPCNREKKSDVYQEDDGCDGVCNRTATTATVASDCTPVASDLATVKSVNGQVKSPPVAGLQAFSGGYPAGQTMLCLQCGGAIGPGSREITVRSTGTGQTAAVHQDCFDEWQLRGPSQ